MAAAGKELVLTPPTPPRVLRGPCPVDQAVRQAMEAALAGNFGAVDHLELTYLNLLVRIGELVVRDANGAAYWWFVPADERFASLADRGFAPFVVEYHRRHGRAAEPAIEWALMPVCRRCAGLLRRVECRICGGDWHTGEAWDASLITTVEGTIIEADPGAEREPASADESELAPEWQGA